MIIAVDHGNKQMKTAHKIFTSGLVESDVKPPFGENIIEYRGRYYALSDRRMPYMRDKTEDNRFFILTLFAIAFEAEAAGIEPGEEILDIRLVVGLPPAHYGALYRQFEKYFTRKHDVIDFTFCGRPYAVYISDAAAFPQAYAAAMPIYSTLAGLPKVTVLDIGGFTADYLQIRKGTPDLSMCDSLEYGVIRLYAAIQSKVNSEMALLIEESEIDAVLLGNDNDSGPKVRHLVLQAAQGFVNDLLGVLRERMVELRTGRVIFVGGGSILLRRQIEASQKAENMMFVDDIAANVKGYELLYKASLIGR